MNYIRRGLSLEPDPEFTENLVVVFGQSSNCKLNYSKKTNSRWISIKMMADNGTEPPVWHTEASVHNSSLNWHQRPARCRKKRGALPSSQKNCFQENSASPVLGMSVTLLPQKLWLCRGLCTQAALAQNSAAKMGLGNQSMPDLRNGPKLPERMPSDPHCCSLS